MLDSKNMRRNEDIPKRCLELAAENKRLSNENVQLRNQLEFLTTCPSIAQGLQGERLVANLTGGVLTGYADSHDIVVKSGERLEVKKARVRVEANGYKRWIWHSPLGRRSTKDYEWLVLIGDKDADYADQYPPELPFVFFLVPRDAIDKIKSGDNVEIGTNLAGARAPRTRALRSYLVVSGSLFTSLSGTAA
jgi:hypothetical protein